MLILHVCRSGYVFQNHAKSRKYTCRVRRYDYTHYQLNTKHFNIIFLGIFIRGAQNLSLPPGARYPRYATA